MKFANISIRFFDLDLWEAFLFGERLFFVLKKDFGSL